MGVPLLSVDSLRCLERAAQAGLPHGTLMQRAGQAAAHWLQQATAPAGGPVPRALDVLCGPGNNGGDGFVLARLLRTAGWHVRVIVPDDAASSTDDALAARAAWHAAGGGIAPTLPEQAAPWVVDALFGIGLTRPLAGPWLQAAHWIAASGARVLALDVPSGLDGERGSWVGGVAGVRADATLTFLADKPGLHTGDGCDAAGTVVVDALRSVDDRGAGAPAVPWAEPTPVGPADGMRITSADFAALLAPRRRAAHKGTHGKVAIIGGATGMVGAAVLAARAALRLGAGRVYVDCIGTDAPAVDLLQPELMFQSLGRAQPLDALVVGCGLGTDARAATALQAALALDTPCVLDADALNLLASVPNAPELRTVPAAARVLTPHPLEAARLLGVDLAAVQRDRVAAARALATTRRGWCVLKGAGTVVAAPDGRWWINTTGTPALATAGTGDVLAGMIGALLAQRFAVEAAVLGAVWLHGRAAQRHGGDVGLTASEVAPLAAAEWNALRASAEPRATPQEPQ